MQTWWRAVASYPPSWMAIAAVILAVVAILVLLQPTALFTVIVIGAGAVAIVVWPLTLSATGTLEQLQYQAPKLPEFSESELERLTSDLEALHDPRPAYQLQSITEKRDNLIDILDTRLQPGELTHSRYESTAQQVYLAVISNLREVAIAEKSISAIEPEYIDSRLDDLKDADDTESEAEIRSLQDRRSLASTQEAKVTDLLAQNEQAMTLLDQTSTALANAPIGTAPQDAEAAMAELKHLAERAGKYAAP
jgi:hypothetical protein